MITVVSGSNRKGSECLQFAFIYRDFLREKTKEEVKLLALEKIAHDWFHPEMYSSRGQAESLRRLQDEFILDAGKFVFIIPEYNGSFPGALKLFIDACSVREYKRSFAGKKAALVGIATGRAGNLRGMDHLAAVLNHVGVTVMPNQQPFSSIHGLMDGEGTVIDEETILTINKHVNELLAF